MAVDRKEVIRVFGAAVVPPFLGTALVYFSVGIFGEYGWTLFLFAPILMGFAATIIYAPSGGKPIWKCLVVSLYYFLFISVLVMAFAIEGLICVAMSLPLVLPLDVIGVLAAYHFTNHYRKPTLGLSTLALLLLAMPFMLGFEASHKSQPTLHQVVSTVTIDAPIEKVWANVVEFPQIDKSPDGILKLGFAYPINAKIDGTGVGAIRRCNFNTGSFVEPITVWDEPHWLAFDVRDQPAPMTELSPYENLHAAHLEYLRSHKGQFRLFEKEGKTVLEGTTFYTHDIAPDLYWSLFSDEIIHQVHLRVLNHIKEVSEK
jgi:hypothetical protein